MNNLLVNKEWQIDGGWYAPLKKLKEYKSVVWADYIETCSSAGDWSGLFIQKIGKKCYVIPFGQENNYPRGGGFTLGTGDLFTIWEGEWDDVDIGELMENFFQVYYMGI